MQNFIFVSPHFPPTYYRFIKGLVKNGFRVLGIGDAPYDSLPNELYGLLTEYYRCDNMDDFNQEVEAVRFFENKYGHIDYLESNNEYWLRKDAMLREMFNINTGIKGKDIEVYQCKSKMKERYKKAGVKTAKYILIDTIENAMKFIEEVGYPVFIKPDTGVGASGDYKISNIEDLHRFFKEKDAKTVYICEQFLVGTIVSFDGICDSKSNVLFATSEVFPPSVSEVKEQGLDICYYCLPEIPKDLAEIGPKVVKAFNVKNRFFHLEFFRISEDIKGVGKKGDIVGLETNMRAPGGFTPDLINFANSVDCYQIWADSMAFDTNTVDLSLPKYYAVNVSRRDGKEYFYSHENILNVYKDNVCWFGRNPSILADCLGDSFYMAKFETLKELEVFKEYVLRKVGDPIKLTKVSNKKVSSESICDSHIDGA